LELKPSLTQEFASRGIDPFQSISLSGGNFLLKIPLGKMSLLYRSIQNYSSVADNTCYEGEGHVKT
jgi:hypothetical protein